MTDYRRSLRSLARGYWSGELGRFDFVDGMVSSISRHLDQAWTEGAQLCGITKDERTHDEDDRLTLETNIQISYVPGLADAIAENSKANGGALQPLLDRVELWVTSYRRILNLAQTMACGDMKLKWVYGGTEDHCTSCEGYEGRVYRGSTWREYLEPYDLMPQGHGLECGGWKCDCDLVPTTDPVTPGMPPIIKGEKHHHEHAAAA